MVKDTKGAFDGVDSHNYEIDYAEGERLAAEFKAEQRRLHLERVAKRKADRLAKTVEARKLPPQGWLG